MFKKTLILLLLSSIIVSCGIQENKSYQPKISYTQEDFRLASKGCDVDSLHCATFEVSYPVFAGLDSASASLLHSKIDASVSMGNPNTKGWSMKKIAEDFIQDFDKFQQEGGMPGEGNWYYKATIEVETLVDTLISLSVNDDYFTGGAHGSAGTYFINVNPKTGSEFTLNNLLKPGYKPYLAREGERAFREARELSDTTSFINNGFEFTDNQFQLNANYGFTPEGIRFVFNSYEVAPYAAGPTEILIPYEKIKDWLK